MIEQFEFDRLSQGQELLILREENRLLSEALKKACIDACRIAALEQSLLRIRDIAHQCMSEGKK